MLHEIPSEEFFQTRLHRLLTDFPNETVLQCNPATLPLTALAIRTLIYEENSTEKAYLILIETDGYIYMCFFAVRPNLRGQGLGTHILQDIHQKVADKKAIFGEVEAVRGADIPEDTITRQKRIRFYERLGYRLVADHELIFDEKPYRIIYLPLSEPEITEKEIMDIVEELFTRTRKTLNDGIPFSFKKILP